MLPQMLTRYSKTKKSSSFSRMTSFSFTTLGWFSLRRDFTSLRDMHSSQLKNFLFIFLIATCIHQVQHAAKFARIYKLYSVVQYCEVSTSVTLAPSVYCTTHWLLGLHVHSFPDTAVGAISKLFCDFVPVPGLSIQKERPLRGTSWAAGRSLLLHLFMSGNGIWLC